MKLCDPGLRFIGFIGFNKGFRDLLGLGCVRFVDILLCWICFTSFSCCFDCDFVLLRKWLLPFSALLVGGFAA